MYPRLSSTTKTSSKESCGFHLEANAVSACWVSSTKGGYIGLTVTRNDASPTLLSKHLIAQSNRALEFCVLDNYDSSRATISTFILIAQASANTFCFNITDLHAHTQYHSSSSIGSGKYFASIPSDSGKNSYLSCGSCACCVS